MFERATRLLGPLYDRLLRHRLPRTLGVYNGVLTRRFYLLDRTARDAEPDYKAELVAAARGAIEPGDTVLEIGSGYGVTTIWCARETGRTGTVVGYEASVDQLAVLREAVELNGRILEVDLGDRIRLEHAVVGEDLEIYGSLEGAPRVETAELPDADVVVMDCEGAETGILEEMEPTARAFVVESHPERSSPSGACQRALESMSYAVERVPVGPTGHGDKHVLVGER